MRPINIMKIAMSIPNTKQLEKFKKTAVEIYGEDKNDFDWNQINNIMSEAEFSFDASVDLFKALIK